MMEVNGTMKRIYKKLTSAFLLFVILTMLLSGCGGRAHDDNINNKETSNIENADILSDSVISDIPNQSDDTDLDVSIEIDNKLTLIGSETLQYPGEENGYAYNAYESYVEITHCPRDVSSMEIPATIDGLPVWVIGKEAAKRNEDLESITIPDTVVKISEHAFYEAENLKSVNLPNSVAIIEEGAFYGTEVPELPISENIRIIGDQSFPYQYQNNTITIPESAQSIGYLIFNFDNYQEGDTITITILSRDVVLSDDFYRVFNRDSAGNMVSAKIVIRGYAGSTTAAYCAEHNKTMEVIPE